MRGLLERLLEGPQEVVWREAGLAGDLRKRQPFFQVGIHVIPSFVEAAIELDTQGGANAGQRTDLGADRTMDLDDAPENMVELLLEPSAGGLAIAGRLTKSMEHWRHNFVGPVELLEERNLLFQAGRHIEQVVLGGNHGAQDIRGEGWIEENGERFRPGPSPGCTGVGLPLIQDQVRESRTEIWSRPTS